MSEKEVEQLTAEERRQRAELDLLVDDDNGVSGKPDLTELGRDSRFAARDAGDNDFAVDPTHKEFRKVTQGHNKISGKKRRRVN